MLRPILACQDPYEAGRAFQSAGWRLDFSQPPESGDPLVGVSLYDNSLLLGVTEGYVPESGLPFLGCGVALYLTVPADALEDVRESHRAFRPTGIETQPWGDRAFEMTMMGYCFMIAAAEEQEVPSMLVEDLFKELSALPEVESIALGGSRAGEVWDEKSDYDVYLYCTAPVAEEVRREILGRYCSALEIGNHFWEYEDNCTLKNGIDIDVLYRNLDDFTNDVASVVESCQPRNGYTTCMWHNLRTCKILYDRDGRLAAAKARFDVPYPPLLRERIIDRNRKLLRGSMPAYEVQIAKAVKRGDTVSVNHRTAAFLESYFDVLFALNGKTHPGEKRLVQLARRQCPVLPERFEENLEQLFADLFTSSDRVTEDVGVIVDELEKIL